MDATRGTVATVALVRLDGLMVDEPTTTALSVRVDTAAFVVPPTTAEVVIRVVTAEPCESVVVTSTVVGTVDVGACDVSSADVGVVSAVFDVGVASSLVGDADVSCVGSDVGDADVGVVSCVSLVGVADSEVAMLVLEVTPVPTTCLFCGIMPAGMSSARTCAKPRLKRASIFACSDG